MTFATLLRRATRNFGGVSASARHVRVPLSTFNEYLAGRTEPRFSEALRIASELGISLGELIGRQGRRCPTVIIRKRGERVRIARPRSLPPLIAPGSAA